MYSIKDIEIEYKNEPNWRVLHDAQMIDMGVKTREQAIRTILWHINREGMSPNGYFELCRQYDEEFRPYPHGCIIL